MSGVMLPSNGQTKNWQMKKICLVIVTWNIQRPSKKKKCVIKRNKNMSGNSCNKALIHKNETPLQIKPKKRNWHEMITCVNISLTRTVKVPFSKQKVYFLYQCKKKPHYWVRLKQYKRCVGSQQVRRRCSQVCAQVWDIRFDDLGWYGFYL